MLSATSKPRIDPHLLTLVARAFAEYLPHEPITIDEVASALHFEDLSEFEQRLGRPVTRGEVMQATAACQKIMDKVIDHGLDSLRAELMAALQKIADEAGGTR